MLAMDCAATEFFKDDRYHYEGEGQTRDREAQAEYLAELVTEYPIVSIEDGMAEDDWAGWTALTNLIGRRCQLVGDDLFVTNVARLSEGIAKGVANSILIKVNQIGTLTETLAAVEMAQRAGYTAVMSAPGPAKPRTPRLRTSRSRRTAGRSRPVRSPARPAGEVQPAHPHRGRAGQPRPATLDAARSRRSGQPRPEECAHVENVIPTRVKADSFRGFRTGAAELSGGEQEGGRRTARPSPRRIATSPARRDSSAPGGAPRAFLCRARSGRTADRRGYRRSGRVLRRNVGEKTGVARGFGNLEKVSRGTPEIV